MKKQLLLILLFAILGTELRRHSIWIDAPDALYHLRRARFAVAHFPRTIIFDPLINFPDGAVCIWPPLFDVSIALPARILKGADASPDDFTAIAYTIPLVYAFGAIFAAGLAGLALTRKWGWLSALFVAVSPGHLQYSQYGHVDQHVAESCWGFFAIAFFLWSYKRKSLWYPFLSGFCLFLACLTWQGSIFWAVLFAATLILANLFTKRVFIVNRVLLLLALPAILLLATTAYWLAGFRPPFTYVSFGWFQPVFLDACLFAVILTSILKSLATQKVINWASVLCGVLSAVPLAFFLPQLAAAVKEGALHVLSLSSGTEVVGGGFLSYSQDWLSQIVEYRPLFADGFGWPIQFLSLSLVLVPVVLIWWCIKAFRKPRNPLYIALLVWGLFTFAFTLIQRRNIYYAALLTGMASLELAVCLSLAIRRRWEIPAKKSTWALLLIFVILISPMLFGLPGKLGIQYSLDPDLRVSLDWLRSNTPQEIAPYDVAFLHPDRTIPAIKTASSVLAFWSQGHPITYYAERPVVADNFGYGYEDSLRFFFATNEADALKIAAQHQVRYVLMMDLLPVMNRYGRVLGKKTFLNWDGHRWTPTPAYFDTIQSRLYDFDGQGGQIAGHQIQPLHHFKLLYASPSVSPRFGKSTARWKIFEVIR